MATANATNFQKFITEARERRDNEAIAQRIFSKDRRQSAPSQQKPSAGGSLASRVGVKKRTSVGPRVAASARNADDEWTHDLYPYSTGEDTDLDFNNVRARNSSSSLTSSTHRSRNSQTNRRANLARGLERAASDSRVSQQVEIVEFPSKRQPPRGPRAQQAQQHQQRRQLQQQQQQQLEECEDEDDEEQQQHRQSRIQGISIRGLAGPYAVTAQNLAPGTSAADIESAMMPVGGEMLSCKIIKTTPIMVVEMVFVSKEGADAVVEAFNNKTADGRIIRVYHKVGGYTPNPPSTHEVQTPPASASEPRRSDSWRKDEDESRLVVDDSMDYSEPRDPRRSRYDATMGDRDISRNRNGGRESGWERDRNGARNDGQNKVANGRLYSDELVGNGHRGWAYDTRADLSRSYRR